MKINNEEKKYSYFCLIITIDIVIGLIFFLFTLNFNIINQLFAPLLYVFIFIFIGLAVILWIPLFISIKFKKIKLLPPVNRTILINSYIAGGIIIFAFIFTIIFQISSVIGIIFMATLIILSLSGYLTFLYKKQENKT